MEDCGGVAEGTAEFVCACARRRRGRGVGEGLWWCARRKPIAFSDNMFDTFSGKVL